MKASVRRGILRQDVLDFLAVAGQLFIIGHRAHQSHYEVYVQICSPESGMRSRTM